MEAGSGIAANKVSRRKNARLNTGHFCLPLRVLLLLPGCLFCCLLRRLLRCLFGGRFLTCGLLRPSLLRCFLCRFLYCQRNTSFSRFFATDAFFLACYFRSFAAALRTFAAFFSGRLFGGLGGRSFHHFRWPGLLGSSLLDSCLFRGQRRCRRLAASPLA